MAVSGRGHGTSGARTACQARTPDRCLMRYEQPAKREAKPCRPRTSLDARPLQSTQMTLTNRLCRRSMASLERTSFSISNAIVRVEADGGATQSLQDMCSYNRGFKNLLQHVELKCKTSSGHCEYVDRIWETKNARHKHASIYTIQLKMVVNIMVIISQGS